MRDKFNEQLEQLTVELIRMGALCEEGISAATKALLDQDDDLRESAMAAEREIDQKERDIENLCMKLLLQQQLHAQVFNVPLFLIDLPLGRHGGFPKIVVLIQQGLGGGGDALLAQGAHPNELYSQLLQLFVEFVPHYPNLPVM